MSPSPIGIIGAMPEEIKKLNENVQNQVVHSHNKYLTFIEGTLRKCHNYKNDDS